MSNDEYLAKRLQLVALNALIDDQERLVSRLRVKRIEMIHEIGKLKDGPGYDASRESGLSARHGGGAVDDGGSHGFSRRR